MGFGQSKSNAATRQQNMQVPLRSQQQGMYDTERQQANDPYETHHQQADRSQGIPAKKKTTVVQPVPAHHVWVRSLVCYIFIAALFAYVYHHIPVIPVVMVIICGAAPFLSLSSGRRAGVVTIGAITPMLHFLAIILGIITGLYAYEACMWLTYSISFGREYSNVLASEPPSAYRDAGSVWFAQTSTVDLSRSVGYVDQSTFCVAPILDSGVAQTTVGFWAIGMDCCGERGAFACHSAGISEARGAVNVPMGGGMLEWSHKSYERAIKQASAVYGLTPEENPIFVYWVKDPKEEQVRAIFHSLGVLAIGSGLFAIMGITVSLIGQMMAA